jgi:hypothetical protein
MAIPTTTSQVSAPEAPVKASEPEVVADGVNETAPDAPPDSAPLGSANGLEDADPSVLPDPLLPDPVLLAFEVTGAVVIDELLEVAASIVNGAEKILGSVKLF